MKNIKILPYRHALAARKSISFTIIKYLSIIMSVLLTSSVVVAAVAYHQLTSEIKIISLPVEDDAPVTPVIDTFEGEVNMLVLASDTKKGQDSIFGKDKGGELADAIMLVKVYPNHKNLIVTSFPRDLMVEALECKNPQTGALFEGGFVQINSTLQGGAGCTLQTIEDMTGLNIPYLAMIDFEGVIQMSNAIGGVEVCVSEPIEDPYTKLYLDAGNHTLKGLDAAQFLRTRHGVGDGSDLGRISIQQLFLSALVRKIKSDDTLTNPITLYSLAKATTQNLSLSENLTNPTTLVSMAKIFKSVNMNEIVFLRVPVTTGGSEYPNRVLLDADNASSLFELMKSNTPITISGENTGNSASKVGDTPKSNENSKDIAATQNPDAVTLDEPKADNEPFDLSKSAVGQKASDITCTK